MKKTIGIDARFYGPLGKGLGRYTQEIVDNILKIDTQNKYVVFLYKENFNELKVHSPRVKKVKVNVRWYSIAEQILFPFIIWKENIDLMHFHHFNVPIFCPTKFVVTIHDLILTKFPTVRATTLSPWMYKFKNFVYKIIIKQAIKKSKKVIAVSEFTKNDIIDQFGIDKEKITVIYEGVSRKFVNKIISNEEKENVLKLHSIKKPFLLYVGNAYPHKNLESLIKIFPLLKEQDKNLQLVLVGKKDYFYSRLKRLAKNNASSNDIVFPGYVSDEELIVLYREALLYVFPSMYEGFGLPPIEALTNGCAVATSDKASMPEVLGDGAIYFNPDHENSMVRIIKNAIQDEGVRSEKINLGKIFILKYDWEKSATETLKILNSIH